MPNSKPLPKAIALAKIPLILSIAVLSARLIGEALGLDPRFFARDGGPSFAAVGIVWLIPIFGFWFGWRVAGVGGGPDRPGLSFILGLLGVAAVLTAGALSVNSLTWPGTAIGMAVGAVVGLIFAVRAWPKLFRYTFTYALLIRGLVVVLTAIGVATNWHSHLTYLPEELKLTETVDRFGFLASAQALVWLPLTVSGMATAAALAAILRGDRGDPDE
ncbi:MAG: hypothetical protein AB7I19_18565 [Planctomycetota bacterium]